MECERSNDDRKLDAKSEESLRLRAVEQILGGESPEAVAQMLGVNHQTGPAHFVSRNRLRYVLLALKGEEDVNGV